MFLKYIVLLSTVLLCVQCRVMVKRDATSTQPDPIDALKRNFDSLKNCIDQSLGKAVNDINVEKQIQPIVNVIGDQLNRFSKAFNDLTASSSPSPFAR